jgi:hypothetical protein
VAVYNRALSAAEVANLYRQALSGAGAPQIAVQPLPRTVIAGQPATFSVTASGGAPYTYQWTHAGTNLPSGIKSILTLPSASSTDAGNYAVTVNNSVGPSTGSQVVTLTVLPPPTTTLHITSPDTLGHFTISGVAGAGQSVVLWKSLDLNLGAPGWVPAQTNTAGGGGAFSFPLTSGPDPKAFYRVK